MLMRALCNILWIISLKVLSLQIPKKLRKFLLYCLLVGLIASCSPYARVVKKGTVTEKLEMAKAMYEKQDYVRALPLFEELLAVYRGKAESEEIYYLYCFCYYGLGQFELAAYHFKNFTENYYNSKYMERCSFMYAQCLYKDALPPELDQTSTTKAISEIQLFLNKFPNAHIFDVVPVVKDGMKQKDTIYYKELANEQIEELRGRLKSKAYDNAMLFYKIEDYNAAMVSFKNALKDYPDMENKDQIEFLIVKSSYYFAKYSIDEKKPERYEAVFTEYKEFVRNNPVTNRYYPEATEINAKAMVELAKHKKLHNIQ
jgi:outer membrane protein assembly factor BamD